MKRDSETQVESGGRRPFLRTGWWWLKAAVTVSLLYPVARFLEFVPPRKPRYVKVHKVLRKGGFHVDHDFILFEGDSGPWAVSRKCTHLGCRLNFQDRENLLLCPCHHSRFSPTGKLINGPARRDLPRYKVARMDGGEGKGYIVTL